jgi:pyruvate-ferredoxin/flavodoxin oxidoreductase
VATALANKGLSIIGGRYGLSSKEFTPAMVKAVFDHLDGACTHDFTVGINDDVSKRSLVVKEDLSIEKSDTISCIFWGLGSDGTVGANKNSIKIIGDHTDMYAQGYFSYDSKKSGGITISFLRFGKNPIRAPYLPTQADFVALHNPAYIGRYDVLKGIKEGGTFLLNSEWSNEEVFDHLTRDMQETIITRKVKFFNINALKISEEVGLGKRINSVMQAAFFKISRILPAEEAIDLIKKAIKKSFEKKGEKIVKMNWDAVDRTSAALQQIAVPAAVQDIKKSAPVPKLIPDNASEFARTVIDKMMHLQGDDIPVSQMPLDGKAPTATARLEKRGIAPQVPHWLSENCIQCNQCSLICPHAVIRAKQIEPAQLKVAPVSFHTIKSNTKNSRDLQYKIQVYVEDCTGCENCVHVCPAPKKALEMKPIEAERQAGETANAVFFDELPDNISDGTQINQIKGVQFRKPLFEFSGACAGCGETPYVKLASQLFGERMLVANATGCSSIYSGTFPTTPYCVSKEGRGPAWANSLFEDNAEYGYGMRLAVDANRKLLRHAIDSLLVVGAGKELEGALRKCLELWAQTGDEAQTAAQAVKKALPAAMKAAAPEKRMLLNKISELQDYLVDKSVWCIGGDGWAYDIGYGGLDHVLASGKNVNMLVLDTEVYSNTGGQASKSTPLAAVAQFASAGKRTGKKDLGLIFMSYGYVYVASVALGANMNQTIKAFLEAEAYPGPSIVIAYSSCIMHGIDMAFSSEEQKKAVQSGYWPLYRYNPALIPAGKNPFIYESKDPSLDLQDFLAHEIRYSTLKLQFPAEADKLYEQAVALKKSKHEYYKKLSELK